MHEPATLTRRAAAALPLAALLGPAAAAVPAIAASGDAELLDLGRRWEAALAAEQAHDATWSTAMSDEATRAHETVGDRLYAGRDALFDRIVATPATSPAGLAVKARVLAYENDLEQTDEASIATALAGARYLTDRAAMSLALDCLRMARAAK